MRRPRPLTARASRGARRRRPRSRLAISPTVAQASTASTIAGTRFSPERARTSSASSAACQAPRPGAPAAPGPARTCARSSSGSMRRMSPGGCFVRLLEAVDAHDHALARLDLPLVPEGRVLDRPLHVAALDRLARAAARLDLVDQAQRLALERVGRGLDGVAATERVDGVGDAGLVGHDLLRAQREPRRGLGGQRQRLVAAVRVQALAAAEHRGQRLERDAHHVVVRLLRGQRHAARLHVEAALLRLGVRDGEALLHQPRPQPPRARGTWRPPRGSRSGRRRRTRAARRSARGRGRRTWRPARTRCAFAKVKAISWGAVAPASRMW